jgi:hypothetical protein
LAEQEAQAAEYDTFQKFNEDVGTYFNDPELKSPMPALPRFRSKVFNQEATRAYQGLQQYSPRAKIIKAREQFDKLRADSIEEMQKQGIDVFDPQTGQINEEVYRTNLPVIRAQKCPKRFFCWIKKFLFRNESRLLALMLRLVEQVESTLLTA